MSLPQCPLPQEQGDDAARAAEELSRQEEELEASEWDFNQEAHHLHPDSPVTDMPVTDQTVTEPNSRTGGGNRQDPTPWNPGQKHPPQPAPAPSEIILTTRQCKRNRQKERQLTDAKRFAAEQEQARKAEIAARRQGELQAFVSTSPEQHPPGCIPPPSITRAYRHIWRPQGLRERTSG